LAGLSPQRWPELVRGLRLSGFARQLAERSELIGAEHGRLKLRIPPASGQLTSYRDRLAAALEQHYGAKVGVEIEIAQPAAEAEQPELTVAAEDERRQRSALAKAQATIADDPFVNDLISGFDATIESVQSKSDPESSP
jgi:DNA polymerase-3 subunit gamma/tau